MLNARKSIHLLAQSERLSPIANVLSEITSIIEVTLPDGNLKVYLYGSWARGDALKNSDIDIAIDSGFPIELATMAKIRDAVDDVKTLRRIDLIDLRASSEKFKECIAGDMLLVYEVSR